jgi:ribonuclease HII
MRISDSDRYEQLNRYESQAFGQGFVRIAGIDEAGRGPLAGPVAAAAVILDPEKPIMGLNDSKNLSEKKREQLFELIQRDAIACSVILADAAMIDEINILQATLQAMRTAVRNLPVRPDLLLVDAVKLDQVDCIVWPIIHGDAMSNSIAAASILAKVTRDRLMNAFDAQYPGYGFAQHKGYGTSQHYDAIRSLGPTPIHRLSFLKNFDDKHR